MNEHASALARATAAPAPQPRPLSPREKAAVVVRLLLAEGAAPPLSALPEHHQAALAEQIGQMGLVDRATMAAVVEEFLTLLDHAGIAFPAGIEAALGLMDGHISANAASRLRRLAGASAKLDPWDRLAAAPTDRLLPVLQEESVEVSAVALSKLPVARAADLLARLPGERARRIAHAVSRTGNVDPETVRRIGLSLAAQIDAQPPRAFDAGPVERVGAILNVSASQTRDEVLEGLDSEDAAFAAEVRRAIFTYAHIPARLPARDVPKLLRAVDPVTMVAALVSGPTEVADFLLSNISQRMAQTLRDEMAERAPLAGNEADRAMTEVVLAIRRLEAAGEVNLAAPAA